MKLQHWTHYRAVEGFFVANIAKRVFPFLAKATKEEIKRRITQGTPL